MFTRTHRPRQAAGALALATAVVALSTGLTGPAGAAPAASPTRSATGSPVTVTLITGDRVTVNGSGAVVRFEPGKGRERVPVQIERADGRTLVLPADARALLAAGKLDRRLFDVTTLADPTLRALHRGGLGLIVQYEGAAGAARTQLRSAAGNGAGRALQSVNAEVVKASPADATKVWEALTSPTARGLRAADAGIGKVWLDGVRKASLDKSTKQIGADRAWQAGFDGTGVKIAVLDTGVDKTHEDLKSQVVAEKNFSDSPDTTDRVGHGTHVASIAAGTGAASGGALKGVAPGAKVISGKVLDDRGYGSDSAVIAGMEWAVAEGASVVNLSLGSRDFPGVDPVEATVDRLSAEKGVLFAIAAGNDGAGESTVGSPGSADAALTVGAVDDKDVLAEFSSRGPRVGDGAVKPDLTAPGVGITAAAAPGSKLDTDPGAQHPVPGYLQLNGTSMATPHVAGAAALLKQKNPGWTGTELKGALTASTKDGAVGVQQQGTGRVQVDKALSQTVITEQPSVSLGTAQWPHADDVPLTKKVAYRNLGTTDITLDLAVTGTDARGKAAPAGFFSLGADKVTVPAGGRAEVDLSADTRLGDVDGAFSAYVTATGGGQSVRSGAAAVREAEAYDVTITTVDRDGGPAREFSHSLFGIGGAADGIWTGVSNESGSGTLRLPKGTYALHGAVYQDGSDLTKGVDWLVQPRLEVSGTTTVTVDARTAKPVDITVPGLATADFALPYYQQTVGEGHLGNGWVLPKGYTGFRSAHMGPDVTDGSLTQSWLATFIKDPATQYNVALGGATNRLATGYTRHVKAGQLAKLSVDMGAPAPGKSGYAYAAPTLPGMSQGDFYGAVQPAPGTRTLLLSALDGATWRSGFWQLGAPDADGNQRIEADQAALEPKRYAAGSSHRETFNTGVFSPLLGKGLGVFRTAPDPETGEQTITASVPLFGDGAGHAGSSSLTKAATTLYRDGIKVAENEDPLSGWEPFTVDGADAEYRLTTSVERSPEISAVSTRIDTSFTFRSGQVADRTALSVSTVRFHAPLDIASRAPAGKATRIPVTVQGAASGKNVKSLAISVSEDGGTTWKRVTVTDGAFSVRNPAKDRGISFRAQVTDKQGNVSEVTIINAYLGK
ncbi:S8 family serine peptidase [Streptomyces sp. NBC_00335]|uniref:S8 family peptidase n=1 Tax=unclassified Streptomyces TaxID=2593676 RepID=UPI00225A2F97|nr:MULTISPECIES: S8 family serine peptidase [unclassified Streptomyces]MCX5402465.1 S8 family serine peptidase [Streptomyces sp. NBC_00086]